MLVITEKVVRLHCMHLTLLRKVLTDVANAAEEREILTKAAAWFATETSTVPSRRSNS
jgi:hypothetical protein